MAAYNALMEPPTRYLSELNAVPLIQRWGEGKRVLMVGGFPFAQRLRETSSKVWVFELNPMESLGEMAAFKAMDYLPQAELVVLTGTTLINHTFDTLWEAHTPNGEDAHGGSFVSALRGPVGLGVGCSGWCLCEPEPRRDGRGDGRGESGQGIPPDAAAGEAVYPVT